MAKGFSVDTNYIKKNGFSNPDTERVYKSWRPTQREAVVEGTKDCGACLWALDLVDAPGEYEWLLCLKPNSPYRWETVHWAFTCPEQRRNPWIANTILPAADD